MWSVLRLARAVGLILGHGQRDPVKFLAYRLHGPKEPLGRRAPVVRSATAWSALAAATAISRA